MFIINFGEWLKKNGKRTLSINSFLRHLPVSKIFIIFMCFAFNIIYLKLKQESWYGSRSCLFEVRIRSKLTTTFYVVKA